MVQDKHYQVALKIRNCVAGCNYCGHYGGGIVAVFIIKVSVVLASDALIGKCSLSCFENSNDYCMCTFVSLCVSLCSLWVSVCVRVTEGKYLSKSLVTDRLNTHFEWKF